MPPTQHTFFFDDVLLRSPTPSPLSAKSSRESRGRRAMSKEKWRSQGGIQRGGIPFVRLVQTYLSLCLSWTMIDDRVSEGGRASLLLSKSFGQGHQKFPFGSWAIRILTRPLCSLAAQGHCDCDCNCDCDSLSTTPSNWEVLSSPCRADPTSRSLQICNTGFLCLR